MKKIVSLLLLVSALFSADGIEYRGEKINSVGSYDTGRTIQVAVTDGNGSGITSTNGALTMQNHPLQISRAKVVGSQPFGAYGEVSTAGAVTKNIIWPNGTFYVPDQTTGSSISFVSSSVEDASGGTGISQVEVHYLDANLTTASATIDLNGTTPIVSGISGVRFIQCMHITVVGSNRAAVGQIDAYEDGNATKIFSIIAANKERCTSSMRMVPAGKRLILSGAVASSVSVTADAYALVRIIATELDNHQYISPFLYIPQGSIGTQNNGIAVNFPIPYIFKEGSIVGMRVTTNKAALVSGDWFGWLEDAN